MEITYIIIALLLVACAVLVTLLVGRNRDIALQQQRLNELSEELVAADNRIAEAQNTADQFRRQREAEQIARVKAEADLAAERRSAEERERQQQDLERSVREQFKALAGDVLGEQSRRFKEENRESMDLILKPFKDNIAEFRTRVESIYSHQNEQTGALKNELQRLMELNARITTETTNLTNALKGNSKVQGDWGEMILETILEKSNLMHGIHYKTQLNIKDEAGNNLRPDVVLYLPGEKSIVIDSKVSLTAYVNYVSAESEAERRAAMAAHVASVRQHVKELSSKSYHRLMQSPDFVIMFVPNEPAFLDALKEDSAIWHDAYEKKVVVSSPTNLFALLKIVDDLWRREDQNKNRENIVKLGVKLYEQLVAFTSSLEGVGVSLQQAQTRYDEAYKRLHTGNDNIARVGERLRKLGLPTTKRLSSRLTTEIDLEDEAGEELIDNKMQIDNE
jgi:DNA recombination protein RmuC